VRLEPLPGLSVQAVAYIPPTPPSVGQPGVHDSGHVDFILRNMAAVRVTVARLRVLGRRKAKTDCHDVPGLHDYVFTIRNDLALKPGVTNDLSIDVASSKGADRAKLVAVGRMEFLPCDQADLKVTVTYPFSIDAAGEKKIRLTIPLLPRRPLGPGLPQELPNASTDLREWQSLSIEVELDDERRYIGTRRAQSTL